MAKSVVCGFGPVSGELLTGPVQFYGDPIERIEQLEAELLEVRTCLVIAMSFWPESSMREEAELSARCRRSECRRNADSR